MKQLNLIIKNYILSIHSLTLVLSSKKMAINKFLHCLIIMNFHSSLINHKKNLYFQIFEKLFGIHYLKYLKNQQYCLLKSNSIITNFYSVK